MRNMQTIVKNWAMLNGSDLVHFHNRHEEDFQIPNMTKQYYKNYIPEDHGHNYQLMNFALDTKIQILTIAGTPNQ